MKGLTAKQRQIADFIQQFIATHHYSPKYRQIANHFGLASVGSIHKYVKTLKMKGILCDEQDNKRALALVDLNAVKTPSNSQYAIALIGKITENMPLIPFAHCQKINLSHTFIQTVEKTYAVQVEGDFLNEEMIANHDILVIETKEEINSGDIIIGLINASNVVVKRYQSYETHIKLSSCQNDHHPILLQHKDLKVQGVLLNVIRFYKS